MGIIRQFSINASPILRSPQAERGVLRTDKRPEGDKSR